MNIIIAIVLISIIALFAVAVIISICVLSTISSPEVKMVNKNSSDDQIWWVNINHGKMEDLANLGVVITNENKKRICSIEDLEFWDNHVLPKGWSILIDPRKQSPLKELK